MLQLQNLLFYWRGWLFPVHYVFLSFLPLENSSPAVKSHPSSSCSHPLDTLLSIFPKSAFPGAAARHDTRGCEHLGALPTVKIDLSCFVWFGFQQMYSQITSFNGNDGERKENHPHDFLNVIQ